jgi:uncharacterized membrane protein YgcG
MNKFFAMMVALVATVFATSAFAWNPPASPAPASWISDPSHVLSDDAHARLDAKLKQINQSSANEIAALILPTLDGASVEDVGDLTTKAWGVGKKNLDNGVLVVLAMKEHKSRISTGKGVEGDLPDLKCNDILQAARPYLRSGNVEGALGFIFDSASSQIANHRAEVAAGKASSAAPATTSSQSPSCDASGAGAGSGNGLTLLLVAIGALLGVWFLAARSNRRRQEQEEIDRQAREERANQRRLAQERESARRAEEQRLNPPAPPAPPVVHHAPVVRPVAHVAHVHTPAPQPSVAAGVSVAAGIALAAAEEENRRHRAEEDRRRRERDEEDARRRRREQDEEDARRRRRDEESSSSSSSSSSSFDWGSSGSSGGSGGFGGGDSGGGGSSSDW